MESFMKIKEKLTSFQIIILGFAGVIVIGALLLMCPVSSKAGIVTPFGKALFTSTSAVCVTGLVVYDTASYWSYFGQGIILILIQIGGLGVITVASFVTMIAGKKISLMQRQTMQNSLSVPQVGGIVKHMRFIFLTSFIVEILGALLLLPVFVSRYGMGGIWMSFFHSVSAFCNAGFDLMGNRTGKFSSLTSFADIGYVNLIFSLLIIIGGIGFLTWNDIVNKKMKIKQYRMQSKVILLTSFILVSGATLFFFFTEFSNEPAGKRVWESLFQAVSPRTAGFNTTDLGKLSDTGKTMTMILMLIGGSPGSTAGGMKTTTIAVLIANTIAVFKRKQNADCFGRRIEDSVIKTASSIMIMYIFLAMVSAISISIVESLPVQTCLFETISAIGTVGLTLGITQQLSSFSQMILVLLMFLGRVGGMTIIYAAFSHRDKDSLKYPVESIIVG